MEGILKNKEMIKSQAPGAKSVTKQDGIAGNFRKNDESPSN
jgi:hypothetical protein